MKISEKLKSFTQKKRVNFLLVLGICGILLLFLSDLLPDTTKTAKPSAEGAFDAESYTKTTQTQLTDLLGQIAGVGRIKVMVTLESSTQSVYATTEKSQSTSGSDGGQNTQTYENDYVLVDGTDGKEALVDHTEMPQIRGVVIICDGGDDTATVRRVTEAVSVVLGLSTNRICVTKMT